VGFRVGRANRLLRASGPNPSHRACQARFNANTLIWRKKAVSSGAHTVPFASCGTPLSRNGTARYRHGAEPLCRGAGAATVTPAPRRTHTRSRRARTGTGARRQAHDRNRTRPPHALRAPARSTPPTSGVRRTRQWPDRPRPAGQLAAQPRLRPVARPAHGGGAACLGRATRAGAAAPACARLACAAGDGVPVRPDPRLRQHGDPGRPAGHAAARAGRQRHVRQGGTRGPATRRDLARAMARHERHRHGAGGRHGGRRARCRALPRTQRVPDLCRRTHRRPGRPVARRARHLRRPPRLPPPHARAGPLGGAHGRAPAVRGPPRRRAATAPAPPGRGPGHRDRRPAGRVGRRLDRRRQLRGARPARPAGQRHRCHHHRARLVGRLARAAAGWRQARPGATRGAPGRRQRAVGAR